MEIDLIEVITNILKTTGPWGAVGILTWVVWKKDQTEKSLYNRVIDMQQSQTHELTKLSGILQNIQDELSEFRRLALEKRR